MKYKHPMCKIWIEHENHVVFGGGRLELFKAIDELGSINKAAAKLGMSYRAAWGKITETERTLGIELIEKHAGGSKSGSELTDIARKLVQAYIDFKKESNDAVDQLYQKHFNDISLH